MSLTGSTGRDSSHADAVVRKAEHGWVVGDENASDLTSAMVLADLFAADQAADDDTTVLEAVDENSPGPSSRPAAGRRGGTPRESPAPVRDEGKEAARLAVTVAQLEHALAARVRVEQRGRSLRRPPRHAGQF